MRPVAFYASTGLLVLLAQALPHDTRAAAAQAEPLPAVAPSPYPASPTTNEFKYLNYRESNDEDKKNRKKVHDAFLDFSPVLKAALEAIDDQDVFGRWFQDKVLREDKDDLDGPEYVKGVLSRIYSASNDAPTERVIGFTNVRNDWLNNCKKGTRAYTSGSGGPPWHFCPDGLAQTVKASDIDCEKLGDALSEDMQSMTGTIIHEFMHQSTVGKDAPNSIGE